MILSFCIFLPLDQFIICRSRYRSIFIARPTPSATSCAPTAAATTSAAMRPTIMASDSDCLTDKAFWACGWNHFLLYRICFGISCWPATILSNSSQSCSLKKDDNAIVVLSFSKTTKGRLYEKLKNLGIGLLRYKIQHFE